MLNVRQLPYIAIVMSLLFFGRVDSFQISPTVSSVTLATRRNRTLKPRNLSTDCSCSPNCELLVVLKNTQGDNGGEAQSASIDAILGIAASLVVLFSEYTLKTTGCGLPAGPYGIVGALEGISYLGVVGICANAASKFFSEEEGSDTGARRLATALGLSAALVGVAVLGFQIADYGYIPNAVPMEGGMCK